MMREKGRAREKEREEREGLIDEKKFKKRGKNWKTV